jgi:hypothetical protein
MSTTAELARAEFAEMLKGHTWDYFGTFTSEYPLSLPAARKIMAQYYEVLKKYNGKLFWIAEEFSDRDGFHIHALIAVPKQSANIMFLGNQYFVNVWNNLTLGRLGGMSHRSLVQRFDAARKAGLYLTKDMLTGKVDYDFYRK